ncbi:MAG: nickel-dependent lactate racemase, partial [bacterium]
LSKVSGIKTHIRLTGNDTKQMLLQMKYGDGFAEARYRLNGGIQELRPNRIASLQQPRELILAAFDKPIVSYPFRRSFRRAKNLTIVVSNSMWPATTKLILPVLLDALNQTFVPDNEVSILVANGHNAPLNRIALKSLIGEKILKRVPIIQHNCKKSQEHEYIGETRQGTPIFVNKQLLDADEVILCSTISHNFITGYSGGPELIVPGCAGLETISRTCSLAFNKDKHSFNHRCADGVIDGNPVYDDIRDACRNLSPRYGIYTIVNGKNTVIAAFAGNPLQAHAAGCRTLDRLNFLKIDRKSDLTIVSAGGAPNDFSFISSYAALHRAYHATRDGGIVILLAECEKGIGAKTFIEWFETRKNGAFEPLNASQSVLMRLIAAATHEIAMRQKIYLVSKLNSAIVNKLGFRHFLSLQNALDTGLRQLPGNHLTYVIPDGAVAVPRYVPPKKVVH